MYNEEKMRKREKRRIAKSGIKFICLLKRNGYEHVLSCHMTFEIDRFEVGFGH